MIFMSIRETSRSTDGQVEGRLIDGWRTEPVNVVEFSDELSVGVKG